MSELLADASLLVERQVKLARLEAEQQWAKQRTAAQIVGAGGALALAAVVLLLVAAAMGLGAALDHTYWLGALIVGGALLPPAIIVTAIGWPRRVRALMPRSSRALEKEISWTRDQLAI